MGKVGAKPALTLRKQTLFKVLPLKRFIKLITIFIYSKCTVYLLSCIFYVGSTVDRVRLRSNN